MDAKRLANILLLLGLATLGGAVLWWASFYGGITRELHASLSDASGCLYSSSGLCALAEGVAQLVGKTPYNPMLFWVGVVSSVAGSVLRLSLKR